MSFEKSFRLASYALLLSGFLTLLGADGSSALSSVFYLAAIALSWSWPERDLSGARQAIVFVLSLAVFALDASFYSGFVAATVHLLMLISLVKLFARKRDRDYLLLYFISFAYVLVASTFTMSVVFLISALAYLFFAILALTLFESKRAFDENCAVNFPLRGYLSTATLITILVVLVSIPIFVVIPRGTLGVLRAPNQTALQLSGFSKNVSLGDMGEILINTSVVMRIKVDTAPENLPFDLKWRGVAFDRYDGKGWSRTRGVRRIRRNDQYHGFLVAHDSRRQEEFLVRQTIYQEPFTNVIFGVPEIILISGSTGRSFVLRDGNDSFSTGGIQPVKYTVFSDLITRRERLSRPLQGEYAEDVRQFYLQLPALHPEIARLAFELTGKETNPVAKAFTLERFLKERYEYSLENRSSLAQDPLYDFLFVTREGHCEYFATAQAVMMRTLGIPARVINGFRRGNFNRWSEHFIVRQSDAHSWVEGYFPGMGWVEFDSTPVLPGSDPFLLTWTAGQFLDAIEVFWTDVVTFDHLKQYGFFQALGEEFREAWSRTWEKSLELGQVARYWRGRLSSSSFLLVLSLLAAALAATMLARRYRSYLGLIWKQRVLRHEDWELAPHYYLELLKILGRRGFTKGASETPGEFAKRIRPEVESSIPDRLTELYYRNRFGNHQLESNEISQIYSSLRRLRAGTG